jgi:hypothetical protein
MSLASLANQLRREAEDLHSMLGYRRTSSLLSRAADELDRVEKLVVSGFYENELPQFVQGEPTHELQDVVTADQMDKLYAELRSIRAELAKATDVWNYYQQFCKDHGADGITDLVVQRDALRDALALWKATTLRYGYPYEHTAMHACNEALARLKGGAA